MKTVHIGKMSSSLSWSVDHCNKLLPLLNEVRQCTTDTGKMMLLVPGLTGIAGNRLDRVLLAEKILPQLDAEPVSCVTFIHENVELEFDEASHLKTIQDQFNEKRLIPV